MKAENLFISSMVLAVFLILSGFGFFDFLLPQYPVTAMATYSLAPAQTQNQVQTAPNAAQLQTFVNVPASNPGEAVKSETDILLTPNISTVAESAVKDQYIIELNSEPAVSKKLDLDKEIQSLKDQAQKLREEANSLSGSMKTAKINQAISIETTAKQKEQNEGKTVLDYRNSLIVEQNSAIADIKSRIADKAKLAVKVNYLDLLNGFAVNLSDSDIDRAKGSPYVKSVSTDSKVSALLTQSVPRIGAPDVWKMSDSQGQNVTGKGVTVAIIDTGIDYTHPDLGGCFGPSCRVIGGYDFYNNDADPKDDHGHGTHCAGIVGANGVLKGVAPDVKFYAYKVLSNTGSGYMSTVITGVQRAMDPNQDGNYSDHADVISMSLGGPGDPTDPLSTAVDNAVDAGVVVAVAAGNSGPSMNTVMSPGCAPEAITVGATCKPNSTSGYCNDSRLASFSSRGTSSIYLIKPEISAPGVSIYSLYLNKSYTTMSGTSMATPHVAGAAALLKQLHPDWTPNQVKSALVTGSRPILDSMWQAGAGELYVPTAATTDMFLTQPVFQYGIVNDTSKSILIVNKGQSSTFSVSTQDRVAPLGNVTATNLSVSQSSAAPSPFTIAGGSNGTLTLSVSPLSNNPEGFYDGSIFLKEGSRQLRIPFLYLDLAYVELHAFQPSYEVKSEYVDSWVYSIPNAERVLGGSSNGMPASFFLPAGNYSAHVTESAYLQSGAFLLSSTFSVGRHETKNITMRTSDAKKIILNTTTPEGKKIDVGDFLLYWIYHIPNTEKMLVPFIYTVSLWPPTSSSSILNDSVKFPYNYTLYISETNASVGVFYSGYAYSPDLWNFFTRNWNHWYDDNHTTPYLGNAFAGSADQQYFLSWEFNKIDSTTPSVLSINESKASVYMTKYDIPGTIHTDWPSWGASYREIGGHYLLFMPFLSQAGIDPIFSGMTTKTVVQGSFIQTYAPYWLELDSTRKFFEEDYSHLLNVSGYPNVSTPSPYYTTPISGKSVETRVGNGPYYPAWYTANTNSSLSIYLPLLRDQSNTTQIGYYGSSATMTIYPLYKSYDLRDLLSTYRDTIKNISSIPSGSYRAVIDYRPSLEICSYVVATLGFTLPGNDVDPPRITDFKMSQRFAPGQPISVNLSAADTKSSVSAQMKWSSGNGSWTNVSLSGSGSKFSGTIPTTSSDRTINIWLKVSDSAGNYIEYNATNASLKQVPVNYDLSSNVSEVEFKDSEVSVLLTGYLTNASGQQLDPTAGVPIQLKVGNRTVGLILDEYVTSSNHTHNGMIRFDWRFNPHELFDNETIRVDANFDLGIYQPISKSFTLHAAGYGSNVCSDGTPYGQCSATKPNYCNNGTLVANCVACGCPSGYSCNSTTNVCYVPPSNRPPNNPAPVLASSSGANTTSDNLNCSSVVSDPDGDMMNVTVNWYKNDVLNLAVLYNNIASGQTVSSLLKSGNLSAGDVWKCGMIASDGKANSTLVYSNPVTIIAQPPANSAPNTPLPALSSTSGANLTSDNLNCYARLSDPNGDKLNVSVQWYKNNILAIANSYNYNYPNSTDFTATLSSGNLTAGDAWKCGMRLYDGSLYSGWGNSSSLVVVAPAPVSCSDGTASGQCSATKPKYCNNGTLADNCAICGCQAGYSCNSSNNACYLPTCSDGTGYGQCSATRPKFCSNGTLVDNCPYCGCPSGQSCNPTNNVCYVPACSDGTLYGLCSVTKPKYCDNGNLVDKCASCGCPSGQSCNSTSNTCYLPIVPPQNCSDGTAHGQCSVTKPKYCNNGTLVNNCSSCGCPSSQSCNSTSNACYVPTCSDGTLYNQCSVTKPNYCSNGVLISNCPLCGCPTGQSCNSSNNACYVPTCSDGTLYGQCSVTKPNYCSNGVLVTNCSLCGCPSGQSCNSTSNACYIPVIPPQPCSDGTLSGQCSATKPKYCNNGTLADNCALCGCTAGYACNTTSNSCYVQTCSDGTLYNQCSATKPNYCSNGILVSNCSLCGCPAGKSCNSSNNACYTPSCSDGTLYGQCSATKPNYCSNGTIVNNCSLCGCPSGQNCNSANNACYVPTCSDGTTYGQCSATRPKYCSNGTLTDNCPGCGCPAGQSCNTTSKACYVPTCSDGTLYGLCSATKPKYCSNGNLLNNCTLCGCLAGQSCNSSNNACYVPMCSDGTLYNQCSATKPNYCSNGVLISNCPLCGCPTGQSCNSTTSACYVPVTPPQNCSDGTPCNQCSVTKPKYCVNGTLINKCSICSCTTNGGCNGKSEKCKNLPAIKSSSGTNTSTGVNVTATTAENLICSWAASDLNGNVDVTFTWYKNDVPVLSSSFTNVSSDVTLAVELASGNLSANDVWMCGVEAIDADNVTSESNSTPILIIEPTVPPTPTQPPTGGGGGGGGITPPSGGVIVTPSQPPQKPCINSLEVTVPEQIFVPQGVTKEISIIVKNTGTCPVSSVAAALTLPPGWQANSYMLDSGLGVNETGIMSIKLMPLYSPIGNYPVTVRLDAPNVTMSKSAKVWLLENPPSVVSQEGPSASRIFEYIIALLLIEFVFGSIVMVIWFKPPEEKLPPLPQMGSELKPVSKEDVFRFR